MNKVTTVNAWNIYDQFGRWLDTVFFDSSYDEVKIKDQIKDQYITEIQLKLSWLRKVHSQCEPFAL